MSLTGFGPSGGSPAEWADIGANGVATATTMAAKNMANHINQQNKQKRLIEKMKLLQAKKKAKEQ